MRRRIGVSTNNNLQGDSLIINNGSTASVQIGYTGSSDLHFYLPTSLGSSGQALIGDGLGGIQWGAGGFGATGSSGTNGTSGTSGTSGVMGTEGTSGTSGTSGTTGSTGSNGTSGTSGIVASPYNSARYVGELYGGGIVAALWYDGTEQRGLILAKDTLGTSSWSNITSATAGATSSIDGYYNTQRIINQAGHVSSAAKLCDDYVSGTYSDWYLGAIIEYESIEWRTINLIYNCLDYSSTTGVTYSYGIPYRYYNGPNRFYYWSSTESYYVNPPSTGAYYWEPGQYVQTNFLKTGSNTFFVRPIRKL